MIQRRRLDARSCSFLITLVCAIGACPAILAAQSGPQPADPKTNPLEWYLSVSGVTAATVFGVSLAKQFLGGVPWFNKIPTWLYAAVVGLVLTALCVFVFGTLPGNPWQLLWQGVVNGATSSGIYEWLNHTGTPLHASAGLTAAGNPSKRA
jgi:hypothetical protein